MLTDAFTLLINSLLLMLRIAPADSFPKPLSRADEEAKLALWEKGDVEARNVLVEHNLRLVAHIIKKYYTQADDADDLISIGTIGLIKGIDTFKNGKGVRLATYASRCIENEILMYFRSKKKSAADVSLSEALDVDSEEAGLSLMDVVAEDDDMAERIGNTEIFRNLRKCMDAVLTKREAQILSLRYGLDDKTPMTQRETAKLCGISRSYVSRIEKHAMEKLRAALGEDANPV